MKHFLLTLALILIPGSLYGQTAEEMKEYTHFFASEARSEGGTHIKACQAYIQWHCETWGYKTELQQVGNCNNVLAWKEGISDTVVVIGAHLDSYGGHPGADDNASGSAAILALAHKLARVTTSSTICFQWYTAEERGLIGSKYYVDHPKWPIKRHKFMLNFDMVGRLRYGSKLKVPAKEEINAILRELAGEYPFARSITYRTSRRSDQMSFSRKGIPVVWLFTGTHRDYHTARDIPYRINYEGMKVIMDYAYAILTRVVPLTRMDYILNDLPEQKGEH